MENISNSLSELYLKESEKHLFFRAAIPGAISMLASSLYQLFDGIFVGQFLGESSFAAVNLVMPFVILAFAVADLIGVGSSVPISIALGQKKEKEANNYFTCACILIALSGLVITITFYLIAPFVVRLMGADGTLAEEAVTYMRTYALFMPLSSFVFAMDNYLRICGKTKGSMVMNIMMSFLSFAFELIFLGIMHLGVAWAAIGGSLGMGLPVIVVFVLFFKGNMQLKFVKPKFEMSLIRQIVANGTPTFLSNAAARITSIVMNIVLMRFGGESAVSIYGVLMYADGLVQPMLYGSCDSLQPAISYNYGAEKPERVKKIVMYCTISACIICMFGLAGLLAFPDEITGLFLTSSSEDVLVMSAHALRLFSLTYVTRWIGFITQSVLVAVDRPLPASILSVCNALVFPMITLVLLWGLALDGLWLNTPVTCLFVAILACVILYRNRIGLFNAGERNH